MLREPGHATRHDAGATGCDPPARATTGRRFRLAVRLLAVVVVAGVASPSVGAATRSHHCLGAHDKAIASDRYVRVIARAAGDGEPQLLGCVLGTGRIVGLANPPFDVWFAPPQLSVAGTYVAFAEYETGSDGFAAESIYVLNLDNPTVGLLFGVVTDAIGSVRVKPDGAVAWIGCDAAAFDPSQIGPVCARPGHARSVMKLDVSQEPQGSGSPIVEPTTLATGRRIDPASLRLAGSTLSWRDSGRRRTATLS